MTVLKVTALQDTAGVELYPAKTWVNLNGTGVIAIRSSGNVSSVVDGGVGLYAAAFSYIQPDVNYSFHNTYSGEVNVQVGLGFLSGILTNAVQFYHYSPANSANTVDKAYVTMTTYR